MVAADLLCVVVNAGTVTIVHYAKELGVAVPKRAQHGLRDEFVAQRTHACAQRNVHWMRRPMLGSRAVRCAPQMLRKWFTPRARPPPTATGLLLCEAEI